MGPTPWGLNLRARTFFGDGAPGYPASTLAKAHSCSVDEVRTALDRHPIALNRDAYLKRTLALELMRLNQLEKYALQRQPHSAARNGMGEGCTAADSRLA
jgi:hypothetical protein